MKTETIKTLRLRIEGRVQGVGFRAWTRAEARSRGIGGWVRNRRDGAVEAFFCGAPQAVDEMAMRCREGPAWGKVSRVVELFDDAQGGLAPSPSSLCADDADFTILETV
ncbi:acylphosphatase [Varunaivibrio sulfuroxidans]|uniref:Acylphosphatase n=1 Tax=Varunaivibrio sulfuroxidans TaxID=1773489 RepID=A0A4V2UNH4_9PROT|nr:acylphosphatase [Varunaivibrio sulfuroxidans]TCS62091.1 acylphosphatase [Varunaivibrio sulfuroxidans]WES30524.1 acylphosphatase [Varunaivibrio sulfuroxidans]